MTTGGIRTNFAEKRHLPLERLKDTLFDYLNLKIDDIVARLLFNRRGVFGSATLVGSGANLMEVQTLPIDVLDGDGNVLTISGDDGTAIQFQNTNEVQYSAGAKHCLIPAGVSRNPRTGLLDYDTLVDAIGVEDAPDAVTEGTGTLTLVVDNIFESGVSHAGRLVTVWLVAPQTSIAETAIERDLVVSYIGGQNVITTTGLLGQGAGAASESAADYRVTATGVTVRRNTDLRATEPYAFLGYVLGNGGTPATFDVSEQVNVIAGINSTLDLAYDGGPSGSVPGAGRSVTVDAGAVLFQAPLTGTGDSHNSLLRLSRYGNDEYFQVVLELIAGDISSIPLAILQPLSNAEYLHQTESAVTSLTNTLTFSSGTIDLDNATLQLDKQLHIVWIRDTALEGLYYIDAITGTTLTLIDIRTGAAPVTWPAGVTANVTILHPLLIYGLPSCAQTGFLDYWRGLLINGRNGTGYLVPINMIPRGMNGDWLNIYNGEHLPYAAPAVAAKLVMHDLGNARSRPQLVIGDLTLADAPIHCGLKVTSHAGGDADKYAMNVRAAPVNAEVGEMPFHRAVGFFDGENSEMLRFEPCGRLAQTSVFEDDIPWESAAAGAYSETVEGGGNGTFNWNPANCDSGGLVRISSGTVANKFAQVSKLVPLYLRHGVTPAIKQPIWLCARLRPPQDPLNIRAEVGLSFVSTYRLGVRYEAAGAMDAWRAFSFGATETFGSEIIAPDAAPGDEEGWMMFWIRISTADNLISVSASNGVGSSINFNSLANTNWNGQARFFARVISTDGAQSNLEVDYWRAWNNVLKSGPKNILPST